MSDDSFTGLDLFGQPTISPIQERIINSAVQIVEQEPTNSTDFLHAVLCQVGIPRRHTTATSFERTNGLNSILIESGKLWHPRGGWIKQPLPSGAKPRLVLVYASSQAIKTGEREIEIGSSTREFLKTLGLDPCGNEYTRFKKQMKALAACRMQIGIADGVEGITIDTKPIKKFSAWCSSTEEQKTLWPGTITLSEDFFTTLTKHAVPLDKRALGALQHSALCLDIYTWLAHRLHRIPKKKDLFLSWVNLYNQFGQEYKEQRFFKRKFAHALKQTLRVYPNARIESVPNGLQFKNSPPPISKTQFLLP